MDERDMRQTPMGSEPTNATGSMEPGKSAEALEQGLEQGKAMARELGERARAAAASTAQDLARRGREQAAVAGEVIYRQGARAGEYLTRNVNEYPLSALMIAGVIGYALGYLIHSR